MEPSGAARADNDDPARAVNPTEGDVFGPAASECNSGLLPAEVAVDEGTLVGAVEAASDPDPTFAKPIRDLRGGSAVPVDETAPSDPPAAGLFAES